MFNRGICRDFEYAVIQCEKSNRIYPSNEEVLAKLKKGLENSKIRRKEAERRLQEKYGSK